MTMRTITIIRTGHVTTEGRTKISGSIVESLFVGEEGEKTSDIHKCIKDYHLLKHRQKKPNLVVHHGAGLTAL